jgi:hypothetical protein
MNEKHIGPGGRFMIFSGVPTFGVAVLICVQDWVERLVGQNASPYVTFGVIAILFVLSMVLSNRIPERLIIPIGIISWVLTVLLVLWFSWFGPGAFGHHTI